MSDSPGSTFALGYLTGQSPLAHEGAMLLTRALRERQKPAMDANTLLAVAQEMEQLLEQRDVYIAALEREISELRAYTKKVEADRNTLLDWTEKAEAELKWRRSIE